MDLLSRRSIFILIVTIWGCAFIAYGKEAYEPLSSTELDRMEKKMMLMSPSDIRAIIQMASEIDGDTTQKVQDLENITEAAERALVKRRTHTPVQTHALDETKYRKEMDTILNHLRIIDSPSNQDPKIRGYSGVIDAEGF